MTDFSADIMMESGKYTCFINGDRLTEQLPFTTELIKWQLSKYKYVNGEYTRFKDDALEEENGFPSFARSFHYMCFHDYKVPSFEEYAERYLAWHTIPLEMNQVEVKCYNIPKTWSKLSLMYRLSKLYPSLVRDLYFYCLCEESGLFEKVSYYTETDLQGKDCVVTYKNNKYAAALYIDTQASNDYAEIKQHYRHPDIKVIKMKMCEKDPHDTVGGLYLYNEYHLNYFMQQLKKLYI